MIKFSLVKDGLIVAGNLVDPEYSHGTLYHASNWIHVGNTRGFRRTRKVP